MFDLDSIADVLEGPAHVGKFLVQDSILSELSSATMTRLDALNGLSLSQNVQIILPKVDSLIDQIEIFLTDNGGAGKRIMGASTSVVDFDPVLETFLPESLSLASLSFEMTDVSVAAGTPVFQGLYEFELVTIADTSYIYWLQQQGLDPYVRNTSSDLKFLPELQPLPKGFSEEPLGKLSLRLGDEIRAAGPEQKAIKILGTEVPGRLLVLAAPLILFALLYYFKSHLSHLTRLATDHVEAMTGFSWLPINKSVWHIPGTKISGSGHLAETVVTVAVLPCVALLVLFYRLSFFGSLGPATSFIIGCTCVFSIFICWMSLDDIQNIRARLNRKSKVES